MTLLKRLLVKDIRKVDFGFVIGGMPVPEEFTGDSKGHNQEEVNRHTFG
ncbi:hypothetical protein QA599_01880 [Haloarculaceae archaeon H-GB1-1]|nr:hypothetical protein [Haloarculaceae archaeon H-GB1-1]